MKFIRLLVHLWVNTVKGAFETVMKGTPESEKPVVHEEPEMSEGAKQFLLLHSRMAGAASAAFAEECGVIEAITEGRPGIWYVCNSKQQVIGLGWFGEDGVPEFKFNDLIERPN